MAILRTKILWLVIGGGFLLLSSVTEAFTQQALSGSEAIRAARCAGDYVCDDDGSWTIADICAQQRAALITANAPQDQAPQKEQQAAREQTLRR